MTVASFLQPIKNVLSRFFPFVDDMSENNTEFVTEKIETFGQFSTSYIILLGASTIICTLGLLLSSAPVVIGGMIMSPMMWPLMKIAVGFTFERKIFVREALLLLLFSVVLCFFVSYSITSISPIKILNAEITARTSPTLLDLVVAIVAGAIAALGIANKKVSDTLAGVAIATSLMPPLCVGGIGLALGNLTIAWGGSLLFFSNIVSIIFSSVLVFILLSIRTKRLSTFEKRGVFVLACVLVLTAIPLFYLLKAYSFKATVLQEVSDVLKAELLEISPNIYVDDVKTNVKQGGTVDIQVRLLMSKDVSLDFDQKQKIITALEDRLHTDITMQLFLQELVSLKSDKDRENAQTQDVTTQIVSEEIKKYGSSLSIQSLLVQVKEDHNLVANLTLISDPSVQFTEKDRVAMEKIVSEKLKRDIQLNIKILPLLNLKSQPDVENERIKSDISRFFSTLSTNIELTSVNISQQENIISSPSQSQDKNIVIDMKAPDGFVVEQSVLNDLRDQLQRKYNTVFNVKVNVVYTVSFQ